jgi:hypothetical protein
MTSRMPAVIAVLTACALAVAPGYAQMPTRGSPVAGTYSNLVYQIREVGSSASSGRGGRNALMPWLYLLDDYTYIWGRDRGSHRIEKRAVLLSGAYGAWGPGQIDADRRVTFKFFRTDQAGVKQEVLVQMAYRGSLQDYPPPR